MTDVSRSCDACDGRYEYLGNAGVRHRVGHRMLEIRRLMAEAEVLQPGVTERLLPISGDKIKIVGGGRCGDPDRDRVIARLQDAFAYGYMSREELDRRAEVACGTYSLNELNALVADLYAAEKPGMRSITLGDVQKHFLYRRLVITSIGFFAGALIIFALEIAGILR